MVKPRHRAKLLYFHNGMAPSETAINEAYNIAPNVAFRCADYYAPGSTSHERCDAVAGEVPGDYAENFPVVKSSADFMAALNPQKEAVIANEAGDKPKAPQSPGGNNPGGPSGWNPNA